MWDYVMCRLYGISESSFAIILREDDLLILLTDQRIDNWYASQAEAEDVSHVC